MHRPLLWFCLGAITLSLLIGAGWVGANTFGAHARAEGTWQYQLFDISSVNNGAMEADPSRFIDDWLRQLPASCDFVLIETQPTGIAYRCP